MREIKKVIVHCSATKPDHNVTVDEIRGWHKQRGWTDIGYHYLIQRCGLIEEGRPVKVAGAHTKGHNAHSIGVCIAGGVDKQGKSEANFSGQQYSALTSLLGKLKELYPGVTFHGHREFSRKDCPCFDVQSFVEFLS